MTIRSRFLSLICVAAGLGVAPAFAADAPVAGNAAAPAASHQGHGGHRHHRSEFRHVLAQLNLTPEQKTQIESNVRQVRTGSSAHHSSAWANRGALLAMAPNDPAYPALLATEKANAAERIQTASDLKTQIYAVLTPDQRSRIAATVAADRAARESRIAAGRSHDSG